ncbi:SLC13 family permease [Desertibacillus haloalkaliphilus]|uniref:SLC13 family permease n=1 Tax=Desertibacillus haloalkaliphilus TaxID=1328930 RepID=UPI001C26FAAE|nr:SLC13 family permease [Desertibacillus haloalkaliphilus]MBU8906425.1 SLC13 family permease [Desertibacillus haloalkaliphilus]
MSWDAHYKVKQLLTFSTAKQLSEEQTTSKTTIDQNNEPRKGNGKQPGYRPAQFVGLILGPLLFALTMLFFTPEGLNDGARAVLATTLWVAVWWITEAIPIPATSLLPLILLPITQAVDGGEVASAYGDPIIFLFLGGFLIALAMEKWDLHKRIAVYIVSMIGTSPKRIILGFMLATGFLSMWVSNTAAVMMMIPIGTAITYQAVVNSKKAQGEGSIKTFEKATIFGVGFAGTIGGLGTLIGTPPNIILAGTVQTLFDVEISFALWLFYAAPVVIILLFASWYYLVNIAFPVKMKELPGGKELIDQERINLGKMSFEEKAVLAVFVFAAFMWISRSFIWDGIIPGISDAMIAVCAGVFLFLIPSKSKGGKLLDWEVSSKLPWGVLLLFGGGLAIAAGFRQTELDQWIGQQLTFIDGLSFILMIMIIAAFVLFLTEITSNTATATMILPILAGLALAINVHPFALMVPAAMAANCAFMLPVGTPPNAIIYATKKITISEMVRTGFWLNVLATLLIVLAVYFMLPVIMGIDITVFPTEFQ